MNNQAFESDSFEEHLASNPSRVGDFSSKKHVDAQNNYISGLGIDSEHMMRLESIHMKSKSSAHDERKRPDLEFCDEKGQRKEWNEFSQSERMSFIFFTILKVVLLVALLYVFMLSLNFMTASFTMVSGYMGKADPVINNILSNPLAALAIGIIVTAILQNSTATTSIAVSMVAAGIIPDVHSAIPIVMGANFGTGLTNSLIALTLSGNPEEFKRAFTGATQIDLFNFFTTSILLPLEIFTNILYIVARKLTNMMPFDNADAIASANFMTHILRPVRRLFIMLDWDAVNEVAKGSDTTSLALRCCDSITVPVWNNITNSSLLTSVSSADYSLTNNSYTNQTICLKECTYWCMPMVKTWGDGWTGLFWIVISVLVLMSCLFGIVKVLSLIISGPIATGVSQVLNASVRGKAKWFSEILFFLFAFMLTLFVQGSSIITATLIPLCGIGVVSLKRVFVMILGANIGTTVTGILTAFNSPPAALKKSMQLAFVYTLFNLLGALFWLPAPYFRHPKKLASSLGEIVFKYRWFLFFYVISVYFVLPFIVFGLALIPHWIGLAVFGLPAVALLISIVIIRVLRNKAPKVLPAFLRDSSWLPEYMRSLEPWDRIINRISCCGKTTTSENDVLLTINDVDGPTQNGGFTSFVRRLSTIDTLVSEARHQARRRTLRQYEDAEDPED